MAVKSAEQIRQRSGGQGFGDVDPQHKAQHEAFGHRGKRVHQAPTNGLSLVVTDQIRQAAETITDAETFTTRAARALAKRTHRLTSGQTFTDQYVRELNTLCEAEPFGGFGEFNWEQAHELLEELGKPALPSPTPKFLPGA